MKVMAGENTWHLRTPRTHTDPGILKQTKSGVVSHRNVQKYFYRSEFETNSATKEFRGRVYLFRERFYFKFRPLIAEMTHYTL